MSTHHPHPLTFLDRYSIQHKTLGSDQTLLLDKHTNTYVLMKQVPVTSAQQFRIIIDTLENQRCLRHEHLLSLIDYEIRPEETKSKTTVTRKIITFFEYASHNLEDQIEVRMREHRRFEESELWGLLCSTTLGLSYLEQQSIGHGCISPIDIFLLPQGTIKLADPSIASSSPLQCNQGYYYSPQLLTGCQDVDIFKSDVFSLGLCAIHAGLLEPCDDCYDYENSTFDFELLQSKLQRMAEIYSKELVEVLAVMVKMDVSARPDFGELERGLMEMMRGAEQNDEEVGRSGGKMEGSSASKSNKSNITMVREYQGYMTGLKPMPMDVQDSSSSVDDMWSYTDLEPQPDTNDDHQQKLQQLVFSNSRNNLNPQIPQVYSQRISDSFQQPPRLSVYSKSSFHEQSKQESQPYSHQSRISDPQKKLTQSRIPMTITTSTYEQQNGRDYYNLSCKKSVEEPKNFKQYLIMSRRSEWDQYGIKQNMSKNNARMYEEQRQLFTDPQFLRDMKSDLQRIKSKKPSNFGIL